MKEISAVILAAGYGTRLQPATFVTPKPMLPIGKYPFLAYLVAHYLRSGVSEIIIGAGYLEEVIREYFQKQPWGSLPIKIFSVAPLAGTGKTLLMGTALASYSTIMVSGGDLIVECDLDALLAKHQKAQLHCTFAVSKISPQNQEAFHTDSENRLVYSDEIESQAWLDRIQKAALPAAVERTSSTGVALFDRKYLMSLQERPGLSMEQEFLPGLICERQIQVFDIGDHFFYEFGIPERYDFIKNRQDIMERVYGDPFQNLTYYHSHNQPIAIFPRA